MQHTFVENGVANAIDQTDAERSTAEVFFPMWDTPNREQVMSMSRDDRGYARWDSMARGL